MIRFVLPVLGLILPTALQAQSLEFSGQLALGATQSVPGEAIGQADVTLALPLSRRVPLVFEAGAYLFALYGKTPHETYVALVWNDRLRLGVVRPAYDSVLPSVFEQSAPALAYDRAEYARAQTTVAAMRRTAVPWGLSWRGRAGQLDWAVSAHHAEKGGFSAASLALRHVGEGWELAAAVEQVRGHSGAPDGTNAKIGGRVTIGRAEAGLAALFADANGRSTALAVDLVVPVGSRTRFRAMGEFTEQGKDDAYGLALHHDFTPAAAWPSPPPTARRDARFTSPCPGASDSAS